MKHFNVFIDACKIQGSAYRKSAECYIRQYEYAPNVFTWNLYYEDYMWAGRIECSQDGLRNIKYDIQYDGSVSNTIKGQIKALCVGLNASRVKWNCKLTV